MLDFPLMLWMKLPAFDTIHPQSKKFATDVEKKTTGDSKLNDSLETLECGSTYMYKMKPNSVVAFLQQEAAMQNKFLIPDWLTCKKGDGWEW